MLFLIDFLSTGASNPTPKISDSGPSSCHFPVYMNQDTGNSDDDDVSISGHIREGSGETYLPSAPLNTEVENSCAEAGMSLYT